MPHKLVRTRNDFVTMQKYHLRLAFHLSKAETVLRIQSKEMNLTSCYFVAPKTNIFFQYIPLVSNQYQLDLVIPSYTGNMSHQNLMKTACKTLQC